MKAAIARAMMALAARCLGESRREWAAAMQAEFETAEIEGEPLRFAAGCLAAAWRDMVTHEEGCFVLTSYAVALGLMMPMAALQTGRALLGLPYLYAKQDGVRVALVEAGTQEMHMRAVYQAAVPSLALLLLLIGFGHVRIAWTMLERDWPRVARTGTLTLAAAASLVIFMNALYLDGGQALLQVALLAIELAIVSMVARWHSQLFTAAAVEDSG